MTKSAARPARPGDDPIAALSAARAPDYDFTFDVAGLDEAIAAGPTREAAAEVFASEVNQNMQGDSVDRIKTVDPAFLVAIVQAVLAIVQNCPKPAVQQALLTCKEHPRSLRARYTKLALARRLPGHWLQDALEAARAMIAAGIENLETDLFHIFYPDPDPAPAPPPPAPAAGKAGAH